MPSTSVSEGDPPQVRTPTDEATPTPEAPRRRGFVDRVRELLGLEEVRVRGFFDDKPLVADDIDAHSVRHDGKVFVGALLAGLLLLGGVVWIGLHVVADAQQHKAPVRAKTAKSTDAKDRKVDHRSVSLSASALPAAPQKGVPIVLPVQTDNTDGVSETVLYDGTNAVSRSPGLASSVKWTPKRTGSRTLRLVLELANGAEAVSPDLKVEVSPRRPGTGDAPTPIVENAQKLIDAINAKNWAAVRNIDPTKARWSDATLASKYQGLKDDALVPISTGSTKDGKTRLYAGLVAHEEQKTQLFCVRWDVDPVAGTVAQTTGWAVSGHYDADIAVADVEQRLIDACNAS